MKISIDSLQKVSKIIEQDSKDTSYKFALLRSTIDVISYYDQQIIYANDRAIIPTGLIVERWLWYYYPLLDKDYYMPQRNGEKRDDSKGNISFRKYFNQLYREYRSEMKDLDTFALFYNDYKKGNLSTDVNIALYNLVVDLFNTITKMPMRYIGKSITGEEYSIYNLESKKNRTNKNQRVNTKFLLENFGSFSIPIDYYYVLKYMGNLIGGDKSIINRWADFVVNANKEITVDKNIVLDKLTISPESFRDVEAVKRFYTNQGNLYCVWSGKKIERSKMHVDHAIPFAHYLNNDIWNLLPTLSTVNSIKSDKIPSPELIENQKEIIYNYWGQTYDFFGESFKNEMKISLATDIDSSVNWMDKALSAFKDKAEFFIEVRGVEEWRGSKFGI
jgi:hypothetical protein